jgi:hypothetical protein
LVLFKNGLTMTGGDCGSLTQLFFDNLSTLLGALFAMQGLLNFGVTQSTMDDVIFGKIVPGCGMTLAFGNIFYSWQAIRLTAKWGRQYTAQPYGLNTPAAFAFVFNIIYTVFFINLGDVGPDAAFILGYKVALAANFVTGLFSIVLGAIGPLILKVVPPAALLVPIAGIGISFLGLEQLSYSVAAPIVVRFGRRHSLTLRSKFWMSHQIFLLSGLHGYHVGISWLVCWYSRRIWRLLHSRSLDGHPQRSYPGVGHGSQSAGTSGAGGYAGQVVGPSMDCR